MLPFESQWFIYVQPGLILKTAHYSHILQKAFVMKTPLPPEFCNVPPRIWLQDWLKHV